MSIRRPMLPIILGLVAVAAIAIVPAQAAKSVATATTAATAFGYVWADQPTAASYTPSTFYQSNSTGAKNTVTRSSAGWYTVTFPGLARSESGGTVNVTAYDQGTSACEVTSWGQDGNGGISVGVLCTDTNGSPADSYFDATYSVPPTSGLAGYVWADSPTSASYTPSPYYQFNSKGLTNTIARNGTGSYVVRLPGLGSSHGTVKVTAYGGSGNRCKVTGWGPSAGAQFVGVACFNAAGALADSYFTMTFANKRNLLGSGKNYGYAWADQPTASGTYTPDLAYSKTKPSGPITITRTGTGAYTVEFTELGTGYKSDVQVTAYGLGSNECRVGGWSPTGSGQAVSVFCYTTAGVRADTSFTIQFIR